MKVTDTHVYFYGGVFSQWYMCKFTDSFGVEYSCAEQYMMAMKAIVSMDMDTHKLIMEATHPRDMKALGRQVKNFNATNWEAIKELTVLCGNLMKFNQNPELLKELLDTADRTLVEASPTDKIWGVGLSENDPLILDEKNWQGQNLLGKALMSARKTLKGVC